MHSFIQTVVEKKHWYYDSEGNTLCTLLKNRNPIMESFRKCGLHGSRVEVSQSESCSIGEAVLSLFAEERIRQLFTAWGHSGREGIDSMSGGSMSPDLGEMWRQGYPVSPQWEGGLELDSDDDNENENENNDSYEAGDSADEGGPKDYISEVSERSQWASIRDYLTPPDVLIMRTGGLKGNRAQLYGKFAALWSLLTTKDGSEEGFLSPFQSGPACVLIFVKISDSTMECWNQDSYRT